MKKDEGGCAIHPSSFILLLFLVACARHPQTPNVLLITLDSFRADRVGPNTPNLQRLAGSALVFRQADSAVPLTLPSQATILSGLLPPHHGLRIDGVGSFPAKDETLATMFSHAGYRAAAFVSTSALDHRFGLARGFDVYDDAERPGGETVDRALAWLKHPDTRPWFVWVHLDDAHGSNLQTYDREIRNVDAQVGRLLAGADRTRTIVVVAGDHGEALGEHGEPTHGLLLYESTLHVPLMIAAPGVRARPIDEPVSTADIAPTIAALAGLSLKADGRDVSHKVGVAPVYAETKYPETFGWSGLAAVRSGDMKLIRGASIELFDLRRDPTETINLAEDDPRDVRRLGERIDALAGVPPSPRRRSDPRQMVQLFRRFEEATSALEEGRVSEAAASLEQLTHEDPANAAFRVALARAFKQNGALDRAIAQDREAVRLSPSDASAWYALAVALQESGHAAEALKTAEEAERLDPGRVDVHNVLGIARIENGDSGAAETEFRKAIALDPRNARAYDNLGNLLRITGRPDDAAAAYAKALQIKPDDTGAWNGLGVVALQQGRTAEALQRFDAALKVAPNDYEAQLNRAIALRTSGKGKAADEELRRLLKRLPPGRAFDRQRNTARALLSSG